MLIGKQTWSFSSEPRVLGTGTAVGEKEGTGPLGLDFDIVHKDPYVGQVTWEKAERKMLEQAEETAVKKAGLTMGDISHIMSGDLLPQNISSNFAARTAGQPFIGLFSACATSMQAIALAALCVDAQASVYALAATGGHNSTAERVFRYPTEYGAQKPPTAHYSVTGAGAAVLGKGDHGPVITYATMGKVIDYGVQSPWEMGAAMAPAAVDTITQHFADTGRGPADYDLIATGDLARVGLPIARSLLLERGLSLGDRLTDCGIMMFHETDKDVFSGGSGPGCCACVTFGHLLRRVAQGELKRILVVATGALLSPTSAQQNETIPCIAHAVSFEYRAPV